MKITIPIFSICLIVIFSNCKTDQRANPIPPGVQNYVYAYTTGVISKVDPIKVRFNVPPISEDQVGENADKGVFKISPDITGNTFWLDQYTLVFEPEANLASNQSYVAEVSLKSLFEGVPNDASHFQFDFKTKDQGFNVNIQNLQSEDGLSLEKQQLNGTITTYDFSDNESVEKILSYKQDGSNLEIIWSHEPDGFNHHFTINGIKRSKNASELLLSWSGKALGVDNTGKKIIEIPGLNDFKVTDARVVQGDGIYILLHFSDPILSDQNLDGLISISDYRGEMEFIVDGNEVRVYPRTRITGERKVQVISGLKNINHVSMPNSGIWNVAFEQLEPQVRLVGNGVIMPNSEGLIFPFEAVSLNAVLIEVLKIYDNNILQFLQTNDMDGAYDLERVGKVILQEKIDLENLNAQANSNAWTRYAIDLSRFFQRDPNAIYQIRIGFRPEFSTYDCNVSENETDNNVAVFTSTNSEKGEEIESFWGGWYGVDGYYPEYEWSHRDDPCQPAYYNYDRFVRSNIVASNIGITAKGGRNGQFFMAVADLTTAQPIAGTELMFYNFQQQVIGNVTTDDQGLASIELNEKPFVCIASLNNQKGYLKMLDGNALSLSRYDVSGAVVQKGMKGFIYGERGVWRPGDSLFLNFILEDEANRLPENYPITFELYDSRGQLQEKRVSIENVDRLYPLTTATQADDPTGNWMAKVFAGGAVFEKVLKIETIKPNRLKIALDFGKNKLNAKDEPINGNLQVNWLHGTPAQNLEARVEVEVQQMNTTFKNYNNYEFDDPAREINAEPSVIFDDHVNAEGKAQFIASILADPKNAPGKLKAAFRTRAFEKGGDFSINTQNLEYDPYPAYVGVNIPANKYGEKRFDIDKDGTMQFALLDDKGNPINNKKLNVGLYKVNWRWWWDQGWDNLSRYNHSSHYNAIQNTTVTTNNKGEAKWTTSVEDWGRYLVRVCDTEGGHCTGDFFYAGYPWYGDDGVNKKEAAMMSFSIGKEKYNVGETIEINVPAGESGQVLITLENGSQVIESQWNNATKGDNTYTFEATSEMTPTIYAHVSLIQSHAQSKNDLPIRMYGVVPVDIENPETILKPSLKMADELKPNQEFEIEVKEETGEAMAYTIAVVDDGLLDLTNFKTPNPHESFYAREALGVKTWDVYDYVLGAFGGELERILSIGGDGEIDRNAGDKNANRFKPVVMHLGPFFLKKGQKASHRLTMPNYVGSIRTMLVASNSKGSYGKAEKTCPVRKPLMVLGTLPRVLGPTESLKLPISVFAMDSKVKNVSVSIEESNGLIKITGSKTKKLTFNNTGEQMVYFDLNVLDNVGIAKFKIIAKGGGEQASQELELEVRNPNPYITNIASEILQAGQSWEQTIEPIGTYGTNTGILEVSNIPPLNLGSRLNYLIKYPHGCIEQTTSAGFPQLYVNQLMELTAKQKNDVTRNIQATINRFKKFQTADGGFGYWPGDSYSNEWGSNYGGHFLLEAKALGFSIPANLINRWTKYQKKKARHWQASEGNSSYYSSQKNDLTQAYRLFTLALVGEPANGAMNRLLEAKNVSVQAQWRLAAAYALIGKNQISNRIIQNLPTTFTAYNELGGTYGSNLRDQAMILETQFLLDNMEEAAILVKSISERLSSSKWYATQTTAYCLLAIGKFAEKGFTKEKIQFSYKVGNQSIVDAGSNNHIMNINLQVDELTDNQLIVKNPSQGVLYARLILSGQPAVGASNIASENLKIEVKYEAMDGTDLNPSQLSQGTDFVAEVSIMNPGTKGIRYDEMVLSQVFPSGWEILNTRMSNFTNFQNTSRPEYQDIKDDRVFTYFDINPNAKQVYRIQLNAAYQGKFYLPTISCEAMYDNTIYAQEPGKWIEIVNPGEM